MLLGAVHESKPVPVKMSHINITGVSNGSFVCHPQNCLVSLKFYSNQ